MQTIKNKILSRLPAHRTRSTGGRDRAQTTIDYTIGISVFLGVVIFVFLFIPGLLAPFTGGTQEETVTANRVADKISQGTLADPAEPFTLDSECTRKFFAGASPGSCTYRNSGDVVGQLGLSDRQNLQVEIRGDLGSVAGDADGDTTQETLCWDNGDSEFVESDDGCGAGDVELLTGGQPPDEQDSTVTAQRVVSLDRWDVVLVVRMW